MTVKIFKQKIDFNQIKALIFDSSKKDGLILFALYLSRKYGFMILRHRQALLLTIFHRAKKF